MDDNNLSYWGDIIRDTVQEAISTGDFRSLNSRVSETFSDLISAVGQAAGDEASRFFTASDTASGSASGTGNPYSGTADRSAQYREAYKRMYPNNLSSGARKKEAQPARRESDRYYLSEKETRKGGTGLAAAGFVGGAAALVGFAGVSVLGIVSHLLFHAGGLFTGGAAALLALGAAGMAVGAVGVSRLSLSSRFKKYRTIIGDREYIQISELAFAAGRDEKAVVKDLEKMLKKGWFVEGHLDDQKTCLITSEKMYRQYLETQLNAIQLQKEEEEKKAREDQLSPEVREIIHTGAEYIKEIHACNDAIPGEEISAKISEMEMIVGQIFLRTEQHPEVAPELRKTMNYYLPTTVKLLHAYEELDRQPVQGDNIVNSKREIEETLDTLNAAYRKLLDSLFKDIAWDVSTDISVMKTLLAQEGLTDAGFTMDTAQTAAQGAVQTAAQK